MMLYLGSWRQLSLRSNASLTLEPISETSLVVQKHVQRDHVYFVGSHSGCSCGFPSVLAEQEIQYFDGVFDDENPERDKDLASVHELFTVIDEALRGDPNCVLFPVWNGSEGSAPKGDVHWNRKAMSPERFLLTEQFRYTIYTESCASPNSDPTPPFGSSRESQKPPSANVSSGRLRTR